MTAVTIPSRSALLVSSSTSHPCAVVCIHVPASDSSWPDVEHAEVAVPQRAERAGGRRARPADDPGASGSWVGGARKAAARAYRRPPAPRPPPGSARPWASVSHLLCEVVDLALSYDAGPPPRHGRDGPQRAPPGRTPPTAPRVPMRFTSYSRFTGHMADAHEPAGAAGPAQRLSAAERVRGRPALQPVVGRVRRRRGRPQHGRAQGGAAQGAAGERPAHPRDGEPSCAATASRTRRCSSRSPSCWTG